MTDRSSHRVTQEIALNRLAGAIDRVMVDAGKAGADEKPRYFAAVAKLRAIHAEARAALTAMAQAEAGAESAWNEAKSAVDAAVSSLNADVESAAKTLAEQPAS